MHRLATIAAAFLLAVPALADNAATYPPTPTVVSGYDGGTVSLRLPGKSDQELYGMRDPWTFNRAMTWLDDATRLDGAIICYSARPLVLTGQQQVSRWYAGKDNELTEIDENTSRFVKNAARDFDHVHLPPLQFHIEQNPVAELNVTSASAPWRLMVLIKGRNAAPLYAGDWTAGPGKLNVDLRKLYRDKGYTQQFAEFDFVLATWTPDKQKATVDFQLTLPGRPAVLTALPVIRTAEHARAGVPLTAIVVDQTGKRLSADTVAVTATLAGKTLPLTDAGEGVWKTTARDLPLGEHAAIISAKWKTGSQNAESTLHLRITDGQYIAYDPKLKMLTKGSKPLGPLTGSYRGQPPFKHVNTPDESLLQGEDQWLAARAARDATFHFWESLTPAELDADYAYLAKNGWTLTHLCQGWWVWERLDAVGKIAPHGAEQLACLTAAAQRHGIHLHQALSHYPLGKESAPYQQWFDAGFRTRWQPQQGGEFHQIFGKYLTHFATLFKDDSTLSSYTAAGEGDYQPLVNFTCETMAKLDPQHLFLGEPHLNPGTYGYEQDNPNYYRQTWKPLLGGMRTYRTQDYGVYKLASLGDIFMGEGVYWGFSGNGGDIPAYREKIRKQIYTALAYRLPIILTWEDRVVEDEWLVAGLVRQEVDWTTTFQKRPRLLVRFGKDFNRYDAALARIPLDYACALKNDPAPANTLATLNANETFVEPAFGKALPEALQADMPLRIPAGFTARHAWSDDRQTLLAFIARDDDPKAQTTTPELSTAAGTIELQNFPAAKLHYTLYDLMARKAAGNGALNGKGSIKLPEKPAYLFLVVTPAH